MDAVKPYSFMVAFVLLAVVGCGQLDSSAVENERTRLSSAVAEAALLAEGAAQGQFTTRFVEVRAEELANDATDIESGLSPDQVAPPARAEADELRRTARLLAAAMQRLEASPGDRRVAASLLPQLKQAKAQSEKA
jgi:hypothetical protein